jgi:hypothetical protein
MEINKEMEMVLGSGISSVDHSASGSAMDLPQVFTMNKKGKQKK